MRPSRWFLVLLCATGLVGVDGAVRADDAPSRWVPHLRVGAGGGGGLQTGRATVEAVTGATQNVPETVWKRGAGAAVAFADLGLLRLGPGDLGLRAALTVVAPHPVVDLALLVRYRMQFAVNALQSLSAVEPWVGTGGGAALDPSLDGSAYGHVFDLAAGCDLALLDDRLAVGAEVDVSMANPWPVTRTEVVAGTPRHVSYRHNVFAVLLTLGWRLF
jgi:hypothetical protein